MKYLSITLIVSLLFTAIVCAQDAEHIEEAQNSAIHRIICRIIQLTGAL